MRNFKMLYCIFVNDISRCIQPSQCNQFWFPLIELKRVGHIQHFTYLPNRYLQEIFIYVTFIWDADFSSCTPTYTYFAMLLRPIICYNPQVYNIRYNYRMFQYSLTKSQFIQKLQYTILYFQASIFSDSFWNNNTKPHNH